MVYQPPSVNPADEGTLAGLLRAAIRKELQATDSMLPVEVVAYDRATNRATVRHLVKMVGSNGETVDRANVASIRVQQPGNGKFSISLPIKPGDRGWLVAADRDISLFQQDLKDAPPNTTRMHSFQDGVFMPDAMGAGDAPAGQGDRVVIGSISGGAYMSFDDDGFYWKVGACEANLTENGLTLNVGGLSFSFTNGGFAQTGGSQTHNGTNVGDSHVHSGVMRGPQKTNGPE